MNLLKEITSMRNSRVPFKTVGPYKLIHDASSGTVTILYHDIQIAESIPKQPSKPKPTT